MNLEHQKIKIDINSLHAPSIRLIENVNDTAIRYAEVEFYSNSIKFPIPDSVTANATFVTDGILISDEVSCEIANGNVIVPIDNSQITTRSGIMLVEITITDESEETSTILNTPHAFKVRVTPSIKDSAQITEKTLGTTAEILKEVAFARGEFDNIDERFNSKLDKSKIESQTSTTTVYVHPGIAQLIEPTDKTWAKDSILKITVLAENSIISKSITVGTWKDGSETPTEITSANINETVTYITTGETEIIGVYIPKESVQYEGQVTLLVECLGLKSEVAKLYSDVLGIVEALDNKANASEFQSQTSIVTKNAEAGLKVTLEATDKTWAKDSILRIAVTAEKTADKPVFAENGRMIAGVKFDGETGYTEVANSLITAEVIYIATADINTVAVTVPWEYVGGEGKVTMIVESLGVRAEIADLKEKVSGLEADIENLRKETPIAKSPIEGKTFSILGDSISTFAGWIPEGNKAFYGDPAVDVENYVPSVTQMWWYILSSQLKMSLITNDSWMGTTMSTTGYKNKDTNIPADMSATAFPKRAESLFGKNNTTSIKPDYIFIFGGTNDYRAGSPVGKTMYRDWASGYTEDWTEENEKEALKSVLPSFCKLIHNTKLYNPHATIVNITFDELKDSAIGVGYAAACKQYGIINVVLENIEMPVDEEGTPKGHPAWEGQFSIAEQVINKLREEDASIKTYIDVSEVGM